MKTGTKRGFVFTKTLDRLCTAAPGQLCESLHYTLGHLTAQSPEELHLGQRVTRDGTLITLKSLGGAMGSVHRRRICELSIATSQPPLEWPDSPLRDLVLQLIGGEPLLTSFELRQTRVIRMLREDDQPVAELSLDSVSLVTVETEQVYRVLEVELLPQTAQETLMTIACCLQDGWHLKPEPRSKFEGALDLLNML